MFCFAPQEEISNAISHLDDVPRDPREAGSRQAGARKASTGESGAPDPGATHRARRVGNAGPPHPKSHVVSSVVPPRDVTGHVTGARRDANDNLADVTAVKPEMATVTTTRGLTTVRTDLLLTTYADDRSTPTATLQTMVNSLCLQLFNAAYPIKASHFYKLKHFPIVDPKHPNSDMILDVART